MKKIYALWLAMLALLVTGCPNNQYVIDLTPHDQVIERKLIFNRANGNNTFDPSELARITSLYPFGGVTQQDNRHTAIERFSGNLPSDVGGAGSYTFAATSLGSAGFYAERFRGDDDVATATIKRLKAADQLVDLVIGWSRMELGRERGYENLRRFLDKDFRRDMKNLSLYGWMLRTSSVMRSDSPEEFAVRFGQYLAERGYFKAEELPQLFRMTTANDARPFLQIVQRLVAAKLGVAKSKPLPHSLDFLADPNQTTKSWENYLRTTDLYRIRYHQWQKEKIVHEIGVVGTRLRGIYSPSSATNTTPVAAAPAKPSPTEVADEITQELLDFEWFITEDQLTVRLALPSAPTHSNGKWDESAKRVVWNSELEAEDKGGRIPSFCYASWSTPNQATQERLFGKVLLRDDDLAQYCLWRGGLDQKRANEWDAFLNDLHPGAALKAELESFRFSSELASSTTNAPPANVSSDFPRKLFGSALDPEHATGDNQKPP